MPETVPFSRDSISPSQKSRSLVAAMNVLWRLASPRMMDFSLDFCVSSCHCSEMEVILSSTASADPLHSPLWMRFLPMARMASTRSELAFSSASKAWCFLNLDWMLASSCPGCSSASCVFSSIQFSISSAFLGCNSIDISSFQESVHRRV